MAGVGLSVIVPTPGGDRPLWRCLASIAGQGLHPDDGDEVIVVGDTHGRPGGLPEVAALVAHMAREGAPFRSLELDAGHHCFGHCQINRGLEEARPGNWLLFQDDDDIYLPGAFVAVRREVGALPEPRPVMFRFISWFRQVVWGTPEIALHQIGGHNLCTPNLPGRVGRWGERYQGDYDFIRSTVDRWPGKDADVVWKPQVLTLARPDDLTTERMVLTPPAGAVVATAGVRS
jgi:hypothetical protein